MTTHIQGELRRCLQASVEALRTAGLVATHARPAIDLQACRQPAYGHYTSHLALQLAGESALEAAALARALVAARPPAPCIAKALAARNGLINLTLTDSALQSDQADRLALATGARLADSGHSVRRDDESARAPGPVRLVCLPAATSGAATLDAGRLMVYADVLSRLLQACGHSVDRFVWHRDDPGGARADQWWQDLSALGVCRDLWSSVERVSEPGRVFAAGREISLLDASLEPADRRAVADGFGKGLLGSPRYRSDDRGLQAAPQPEWRQLAPIRVVQAEPASRRVAVGSVRQWCDYSGPDAVRYSLLDKPSQQRLRICLSSRPVSTLDQPLYRMQYASARVASMLRRMDRHDSTARQGRSHASARGHRVAPLCEALEFELVHRLGFWPAQRQAAARAREPHQVTTYLRDLANGLHKYHEARQVHDQDPAQWRARRRLLHAAQQVLAQGAGLLGVQTPEVL